MIKWNLVVLFLLTIMSVAASQEVEVYTYDSYYDAANHHSSYSEQTHESYERASLGNGYYDSAYGGHEYYYDDEHYYYDRDGRRYNDYYYPRHYYDEESYSYSHETSASTSRGSRVYDNARYYYYDEDVHPSEYPTRVAAYDHQYDAQVDANRRGYDYPHEQRIPRVQNTIYRTTGNVLYQEAESYSYDRRGRYTRVSEDYDRYESYDANRNGANYHESENYDYSKRTLRHTGYKGGYCDRGSYGVHSNPGGGYYRGYERRC